MERRNIAQAVEDLLRERGAVTSGALAERLGVGRHSAHAYLRSLVAEGALARAGAGRGTRYHRAPKVIAEGAWPRAGLSEDSVWQSLASAIGSAVSRPNVRSILHYAMTEMVNNAIDHSGASTVSVRVSDPGSAVAFEVEDDGIGIFEHLMASRGLPSPYEAIAELQKGKVTTMPEAHSGEGIFFTSRLADRMAIGSGRARWVIDRAKDDQSVETTDPRTGTLVRFEIDKATDRTTESVFRQFESPDHGFSRTRTSIKLFTEGDEIVSRSEAKRLLAGLERFDEIELDFRHVRGIGQGFADEVFRVWQQQHPGSRLIVEGASAAVRFMIDRVSKGAASATAERAASTAILTAPNGGPKTRTTA